MLVREFLDLVRHSTGADLPARHEAYSQRWEKYAAAWLTYLESEWLDDRWYPLLMAHVRNLVCPFRLDTTNAVTVTWQLIKHHSLRGWRAADMALLVRLLVGWPGDDAAVAFSLMGRARRQITDVLCGGMTPNVHIHQQAAAAAVCVLSWTLHLQWYRLQWVEPEVYRLTRPALTLARQQKPAAFQPILRQYMVEDRPKVVQLGLGLCDESSGRSASTAGLRQRWTHPHQPGWRAARAAACAGVCSSRAWPICRAGGGNGG
jgi:hypothetical protein